VAKLIDLIRRAAEELGALLVAREAAIAALEEQAAPRRVAMRKVERAVAALEDAE
jgi:hypothetical protein